MTLGAIIESMLIINREKRIEKKLKQAKEKWNPNLEAEYAG